jgi:hypothetical protein
MGVYGEADYGASPIGVYGYSDVGYGVYGRGQLAGVSGVNYFRNPGVLGNNVGGGPGVLGQSNSALGVEPSLHITTLHGGMDCHFRVGH